MPKVDIKELKEKSRIVKSHDEKRRRAVEAASRLIESVYKSMTERPTEQQLPNLNDQNAIMSFRGTFLSNFYACSVRYKGKRYSSVEHAYQAQKFTTEALGTVPAEAMDEVHEVLRTRGVIRHYKRAQDLFADPNLASGNIKLAADIFRKHELVRPEWDDMRVPVMAELLIQKYAHPELNARLKSTAGKYLVEGNVWNDTLWGVCDGKGRNMLGQMLMYIRDTKY